MIKLRESYALLSRWLKGKPVRVVEQSTDSIAYEGNFAMTGPDLIERVARSIQLNQSILLEGPRGCGKSYCIKQGIKVAASRGIIPRGAEVFVQGNREIPRDYLSEDEISFKLVGANEKNPKVIPYRKSAPLFRFAKRDMSEGNPEKVSKDDDNVICEIKNEACERFVLNLDEINRFSDGVLDSLLSILEERVAILGGEKYILPVTVAMTMNPPGYDSSARKLSPPLAARIGRCYRLSTPDIDTMSDLIVVGRWNSSRSDYENEKDRSEKRISEREAQLTRLLEESLKSEERMRLQKELEESVSERARFRSSFPPEDPLLIRKAALVTLCLWGEVTGRSGMEYLTPDTRRLLERVMARDSRIAIAMRSLSGLCHYGPDGRAVADWIVSATALCLEEAAVARRHARLEPRHLVATATSTLCHKIYDKFSSATQPEKSREKERIVQTIARQVLTLRGLDDLISRDVDDTAMLWHLFGQHLYNAKGSDLAINRLSEQLREKFLSARVTSDDAVAGWLEAIRRRVFDKVPLKKALCEALSNWEEEVPMLIGSEPSPMPEKMGFTDSSLDILARDLVTIPNLTPIGMELLKIVSSLGPIRRPFSKELTDRPIVRLIGLEKFRKLCQPFSQRYVLLVLANEMEELAIRDYLAEFESRVENGISQSDFIDELRRTIVERLQPVFTVLLTDRDKQGADAIKADFDKVFAKLLKVLSEQIYCQGGDHSEDNAAFLSSLTIEFEIDVLDDSVDGSGV